MNKDAFTTVPVVQEPIQFGSIKLQAALKIRAEGRAHEGYDSAHLEEIEKVIRLELWHHVYGEVFKAGQEAVYRLNDVAYRNGGSISDIQGKEMKALIDKFLSSFPDRP